MVSRFLLFCMEKAMATHSSTLAWKNPMDGVAWWVQPMGSLRVGTTERLDFHFSLSCIGEGNGTPLQLLPGESQGQEYTFCHKGG